MALETFDVLPDPHRRQYVEFVATCRTSQKRRERSDDVVNMLRTHARKRELKRRGGPSAWRG